MAEKITIDKNMLEDWMKSVNGYIEEYSRHPFTGDAVGEVIDDAVATRGKMLRPRLLLMSATFGPRFSENRERLCKLAAMVELTHMASLIHDDIVDEAPSRRGKPSIQHKYGKSAAVYAGDFLMSRISRQVAREDFNRPGEVMARTVEEMCAGEIGQARCRYREDMTAQEYMRNIHGKTAALFMAACRIGAEESGCDTAVIRQLERFAECLGILFQLRDDLMDYVSDEQTEGKRVGKDFREGIYTLPLLCALEASGGKEQLLPYLRANAEGTLSEEQVLQVKNLIYSLGGIAAVKSQIRVLRKQAEQILREELPPVQISGDLIRMLKKLTKDL